MADNPVIRISSDVQQTLYVTGYYGFAEDDIIIPAGTRFLPLPDNKRVLDVAQITLAKYTAPVCAMIYFGLSSASRDLTCYMKQEGEKFTWVIGRYKGNGVAPEPLDEYASFVGQYHDKDDRYVWRYQINKIPFSAANTRLLPIVESAAFAGEIFFREYALPKMVLGALVRGADGTFASTVLGWVSDTKGHVPDEHTAVPIASITKAFTGHLLARMVAKAKGGVGFTDLANEDPAIRFIDLVTHTSGLPREVTPNIDLDPLEPALLPSVLFPPGTGASYSNVGFNLLGRAIYDKCKQPEDRSYYDLLKREVLSPIHLDNTSFNAPLWEIGSTDDLTQNLFGGHDFDGKLWTRTQHDATPRGASGLYSTPGDILRWLEWHLNACRDQVPIDTTDTDARLLNHAAYVQRDGLSPVIGLDESGHMDAMGLGWVVMMPKGDRPFILQKSGGTTGVFSFVAFSPARGIGFFISIDQFNVAAGTEMAEMIADLIMSSAPR